MRYNGAMDSKKIRVILFVVAVIVLVGGIIAVVRYMRAPKAPAELVVARAQYAKGNASFLYPAMWKQNDIPTSPGFISVQVYDPTEGIVFVASSSAEESDPHVDGALVKNADIAVGGISGKERIWENDKTLAVVMRTDKIMFAGRAYRFEMFGHLSRKVPMQKYWSDIMSSITFSESESEEIQAAPATSTTPAEGQ